MSHYVSPCKKVRGPRPPCPPRNCDHGYTYAIVVRWNDELLCGGLLCGQTPQIGVSILDAVYSHSVNRWGLSEAGVQAPWYRYGVLETVWLLCDEAQKVGCLLGWERCPLVEDAGIQSQFARRRWGRVNETGMSPAAPDSSAVSCSWIDRVKVRGEFSFSWP